MKKIYTTLVAVFAIVQFSFAQWTPGTGKITTNNNVGIGTTNPERTLDIQTSSGVGVSSATGLSRIITAVNDVGLSIGQSNVARHLDLFAYGINQLGEDMYLNAISHNIILQSNGGKVGIGVTTPLYTLDVGGTLHFGSTTSGLSFENIAFHNHLNAVGSDSNIGIDIQTKGAGGFTVNGNKLFVDGAGSGYVGIGTTTPQEALSVNGDIRSKQVKVQTANWPDYVFSKEYKLPTLLEVKSYIDEYQHLPDMPSEADVTKDGLNLGEINKLLTKKVEELTLYLIEEHKKNSEQQGQLNELKRQMAAIAKALNKN